MWYIFVGYRILISMKAVLLKLPDELVEAGDACADSLGVSRAEYIRRAIDRMNRETARARRARDLVEASKKVRAESCRVSAEFDAIEEDVDA
jgi:predicted DNA-binding protein